MSRAYTEQEVREKFLKTVWRIVDFWDKEASEERSIRERLSGVAFSILAAIDGENGSLPAFDLVCAPHENDKEYHENRGEDYYPPEDCNISGNLHHVFKRVEPETVNA
jgi:hypothetical protein